MSSTMTPALLMQAIENFRPEKSLQKREDFDRFYVERPLTTLAGLKTQIEVAAPEAKFLVYGHRGCGKTSELNRLALHLEQSHFTVVLSLEEENDLSDLHYTEILTSLCRSLIYRASSCELNVSNNLLKDVLNWFSQVEEVTERSLGAEAAFTQKVSVYFLELFSKQKAELSKRETRRRQRERHEGELLDLINRLIDEVQQADARKHRHKQPRPVFAIVDSLDRCKLETVRQVFRYTEALFAPRMKTIYTVPQAFSREKEFSEVCRNFGEYRWSIPVMTLFEMARERGGEWQRDAEMWRIASEIIERRLGGLEMDNPIRERLIEGSGGVLSILFNLCYNACVMVKERNLDRFTEEIATQVLDEYQGRFYELLREEDYQVLSQDELPGSYPVIDDTFLSLVYANCILSHTTRIRGRRWYGVHPLVQQLVDEWKAEREGKDEGEDEGEGEGEGKGAHDTSVE